MTWLADHFLTLTLDEDHEGYFLGRGAKEESLVRFGVKSWRPLAEDAPLEDFRERYGPRGERLVGWVLWPLWSPAGRFLGFAGRKHGEKLITRYLLSEAGWQPIWTGLFPETMQRIWDGADVWVVEGIFDLFPLEWATPSQDVILGSERAHLTDKHVEFLRRFVRRPYRVRMAYDNDEAGRKGTHGWVDETGKKRWGAIQRLERVEVWADPVTYTGKDPGEVWNSGGVAAVRAAFNL
jgi:hypothetical protein